MLSGLSSSAAQALLRQHGYNELPSAKPKTLLRIALETLREPIFLLLIACSTLYIILGDYREGFTLFSTSFIIIGITFYQYRKTEKTLVALRQLTSPRVLVIRDGTEIRIPGREVVPGDCVLLHEGDRVPADAVLTDSLNLMVDESLLTGESMPVEKNTLTNKEVISGSLVVRGKGVAQVLRTGPHAQLGLIAGSIKGLRDEETRLQKEMKSLIRVLAMMSIVICIVIILLFYYTRGQFIQSLLNGLSSSMAILPEEFPVVLTVFLALGAWRLSKKNVLTRKPSAIESLGSTTVLCTDKTGTITQNQMQISALYDGQVVSEAPFKTDTASMNPSVIEFAFYATPANPIDPMEKAIIHCHDSLIHHHVPLQLVKEYPLSESLPAMTRVWEHAEDRTVYIAAKGAPEAIFRLCRMDTSEVAVHLKVVHALADKGSRVIGIARGTHPGYPLPDHQSDFTFTFAGLVALEDPVRPEVPKAILECRDAGIKVIMITGDFPSTAQSIGRQIGLDHQQGVITGSELETMSDASLQEKIKHISIFARIVPAQKLRIIRALKANGEIVTMTGDGVNDAPALKAAQIGIAMGNKGTDVAREASSLVLLDDNFASIVSAVRTGRRIFDNLQKAMSYILAIHIPIIGITLLPAFNASLPLVFMPLHIVFMELIIDPVCSIAFESEQDEKNIMRRPPRPSQEKFFGLRSIMYSLFQGFLLFSLVLMVYLFSIREGHTEGEIRAITFSALIIGNIFLILTNLSKTRSFLAVIREKNKAAIFIPGIAAVILYLSLTMPQLRMLFTFEFPGYRHFLLSAGGATAMLMLLEIIKWLRNKKSRTT